jgi:2-polyprenyl-3-methyl-5-hydroxy-6-metoxy-1,4-benzoquinol methylase
MKNLEKFWDRAAKSFDKNEKRFEQTRIKVLNRTKEYLRDSDVILDYGCGPASMTCEIAGVVKKIYGIDISFKMIEAAKRKADKLKIENADFAQSTIFDEKLVNESFDAILVFNILHFFEDPLKVVNRINELLKPGGLIISVTPCLGENMALLTYFQFSLFLMLSKIGLIPYIKRFRFQELDDIIANGNFKTIETEKFYQEIFGYFIVAKKQSRT